jgi:hypothetical protein
MTRVFIEPGNPHDISRADLEDLATLVREGQSGLAVEVSIGEEQGYGVTFAEVLRIYMDAGEVAGDTAALFAPFWIAVRWMRARWTRDKETHEGEQPRTRYVTLYGADGKKLKSVKIDTPEGEPEEIDEPESLHHRPWPPDRT